MEPFKVIIATTIREKLQKAFAPLYLDVINESHMHSVPANSETHFKVVVVSENFIGKRQVQRHQQIYAVLGEELQSGVHALAIHTFAPDEWQERIPASPTCRGGSKQNNGETVKSPLN